MDRRHFISAAGVAGATTLITSSDDASAAADGLGLEDSLVASSDASGAVKSSTRYVCTGDNDHAVINRAITELGSRGGMVRLSRGRFNLYGAVKMRRRVALKGEGKATILVAKSTWLSANGGTGAMIEPFTNDTDKTLVSHLSINGNRWAGPKVSGIHYNITSKAGFDEGPDAAHVFSYLYITATHGHGIYLSGSQNRANKLQMIRVFNVGTEQSTESHGFYVNSADNEFHQCDAGSSSGAGFYISSGNNRFTNCKAWYSDLSGWIIKTPRNILNACESQDNAQHGFLIKSGPNTLTGCQADSNSWNSNSPTAAYDGYHLPWSRGVQVVGCSAYDKDEGGRGHWQRYGVFMGRSSTQCQVMVTTRDHDQGASGGEGISNSSNQIMINGS